MIRIKLKNSLMVVALAGLISACGQDAETPPEQKTENVEMPAEAPATDQFYDIPSPIQQVQLLQKAGAKYDASLLNPLENISKYSLTNSKALNLGIYGADLSYAAVFGQTKDAIQYLSISKKLSEELGIKGDFYLETLQRLGQNPTNNDSLIAVVSYVYKKSNESLKENDQSHISALVVVGSFIEGMYIGTQVAKTVKDKQAIYDRIAEFKGSLNNLVGLIATVNDSGLSDVLADLKSIKVIYDEAPDSKLTEAQIIKITKQVKAIRIKVTNS
jgi:hypothetical protein